MKRELTRFEETLLHIAVIVIALFANKMVTYEFSVSKYALLTAFAAIIAVLIFRRWYTEKKLTLYISMANIGWLFFALACILSTLNVSKNYPSYFRYSFDIAIYVLLTALISIYISNRFARKAHVTRLLLTFMGTGMIVAIDSLLNFYTGFSIFLGKVGDPLTRSAIKSTIGNTIFVSDYMGMLLPISLYFVLSYDFGWKQENIYRNVLFTKLFAFASFALMLTTVIISQTRSEYIAILLSFAVYGILYWIYKKRNRLEDDAEKELMKTSPELARKLKRLNRLLLICFVVVVMALIVVYNTPNALTGGGKVSIESRIRAMTSVSSWDERLLSWLTSVYHWKDSKIIGTGIGTYQLLAISYMGDVMEEHPQLLYGWNNFKRTHNDYLQVLGETGILGFSAVVFCAVVLILYTFKYLNRVKDRDNTLLFLALGAAFVAFMVQTAFSFPGHLLPNGLLALFIASVAFGRCFNSDRILAFEFHVRGPRLLILGVIVAFVVACSGYLKWNYFISEVMFKNGNNAYTALMKVEQDKNTLQEYEKIYSQKLADLKNYRNEFSYLSPENYKPSGVSESERESRRIQELMRIQSELEKTLTSIRGNMTTVLNYQSDYLNKAEHYLFKAIDINHTYGKAYFYLASLALQASRIQRLEQALKQSNFSVLDQSFDAYQRVIADQFRTSELSFLKNALTEENIQIVATMQALEDSIALYKTSLLYFNERNSYKALAIRYSSLYDAVEVLINADSLISSSVRELLVELQKSCFEGFKYYVQTALYNLPGSWNRFSDWKNVSLIESLKGQDVYRLFATLTSGMGTLTDQNVLKLLFWLAEREAWACKYMAQKGVWAVPDALGDFLFTAQDELFKNGSVYDSFLILQEMLNIYREHYKRISSDIQNIDVAKALGAHIDSASSRILTQLQKNSVPSGRIEFVLNKIQQMKSQAIQYVQGIEWQEVIETEISELLNVSKAANRDWTKKVLIWNSISSALTNEIDRVLKYAGIESDLVRQIVQSFHDEITQEPFYVALWERENRFLAFFKFLVLNAEERVAETRQRYSALGESDWQHVIQNWAHSSIHEAGLSNEKQIMDFLDNFFEEVTDISREL